RSRRPWARRRRRRTRRRGLSEGVGKQAPAIAAERAGSTTGGFADLSGGEQHAGPLTRLGEHRQPFTQPETSGGLEMHPFFRPPRPRSSAPEQTPYQRAGQVWDQRMGLSIAHARNWRRMAAANLLLAAFLGAGWWVEASRAEVRPYVVEISDLGEPRRITALDGRYEPTRAQVAHALAGWVRDARSKSIDPVVIRENWLNAYHLLGPRAAGFLNDWA